MHYIGHVILLVRAAPQRNTLAYFAEMNRLLACALGHRAPTAIAHPAEIAADIAGHYADIRALVLKAHSVRLCITVVAAHAPIRAVPSCVHCNVCFRISKFFCIKMTYSPAIICAVCTRPGAFPSVCAQHGTRANRQTWSNKKATFFTEGGPGSVERINEIANCYKAISGSSFVSASTSRSTSAGPL